MYRQCFATFAVLLFAALPAAAATVTEEQLGQFSKKWQNPTFVPDAYTTIQGEGKSNQYDLMYFNGFAPGAQQIELTFSAPANPGHSYSAGGAVTWQTTPFAHGWDGETLGSFQLAKNDTRKTLMLELGEEYVSQPLYLGLWFTHGRDIDYTIVTPRRASAIEAPAGVAAAVPLPPSLLLLGGALLGGGVLARRRGRADAAPRDGAAQRLAYMR